MPGNQKAGTTLWTPSFHIVNKDTPLGRLQKVYLLTFPQLRVQVRSIWPFFEFQRDNINNRLATLSARSQHSVTIIFLMNLK